MIYVISFSDHDTYVPVIVQGPEVKCWETYCKSLIDEAILRTLKKAEVESFNVGWCNVLYTLQDILKNEGYRVVRPPEFIMEGELEESNGILSKDVLDKVTSFNENFRRELNERVTKRLREIK